jgi:hypothetical protein
MKCRLCFESLIKGSEPLFTATGTQYGFTALPDNKTRTGYINATNEGWKWNTTPEAMPVSTSVTIIQKG